MKATHRVKDNEGKTVGFLVGGEFIKYYNVMELIKYKIIENLTVDKNGVIKFKSGALKEYLLEDINKKIYDSLCEKNALKRDITRRFDEWRMQHRDLILFVKGTRQVGKTTEILKYAYKNYEQVIYVNLALETNLKAFEQALNINPIRFGMVKYCMMSDNFEYKDSKNTVIIIDEIQESYKVYNMLRSFQLNLKCDIIVTGSYLGATLNNKFFVPVGNTYDVEMLPLSFREFCNALGLDGKLMNVSLYGKSDKDVYVNLTQAYKTYIEIGGYPAVVRQFMRTKDINVAKNEIRTIINRFNEESAYYFKDDKCKAIFRSVYTATISMIAHEKKGTDLKYAEDVTNFVKNDTKEHVSRKEINNAIAWLYYSGIIGSCDLYNNGNVNELLASRRFYFMDCGVANYLAFQTSINLETIKGMLAENFVYTELYRLYKELNPIVRGTVPCCSIYNNYELDFMILDNTDKVYGIEVKSNESNNHKSLDIFLSKGLIDEAYLVQITKGGIGKSIKSIPIYTVGCRFPYKED